VIGARACHRDPERFGRARLGEVVTEALTMGAR
jgi:hypothetical protein